MQNKGNRFKVIGSVLIPLVLLAGSPAANAATDLIKDIDATVLSIHDFSVKGAQLKTGATYGQMRSTERGMILKLGEIRKELTTLDAHLTKNWTYLSTASNYTYPDRNLMRTFETQSLAWYNFQLGLHKKYSACLSDSKTGTSCLLAAKKSSTASESKLYNALGKTLSEIEMWRKAAKR